MTDDPSAVDRLDKLYDDKIEPHVAWKFMRDSFQQRELTIHPSMIPLLLPWKVLDNDQLQLHYLQYNHNSLSPFHAYEICNNISGNPLNVQGNLHDPVIKNNIQFVGTVWNRKEDLVENYQHLHPLHLVAVSQEDEPTLASFVPHVSLLRTKTWYDKLCGDLEEYLKLDATKVANLKIIIKLNDLKIENLDEKNPSQMYYQVLLAIAKQGAYKDFYTSAMEGYHRVTGLVHALLRSTIDQTSGMVVPDSIKVKDFLAVQLKIDHATEDSVLRDRMKHAFFDGKKSKKIPCMESFTTTMYFPKKAKYNVIDTASHIIRASRAIAEQKKASVTKCPFAQIGNLLSKYITNMTEDQMTYRADFSDIDYPTHPPGTTKQCTEAINKAYADLDGHDMCKAAYEYCDLIDNDVYKEFLKNPLSDANITKAVKLLQRPVLKDSYHIVNEGAIKTISERIEKKKVTPPSNLSFPFYPSFKAMSLDIGTNLDKRSKLNPYIANNMILGPMVYTILYAAMKNAPVADTLDDEKRTKQIHYWLRFHNNMSHKKNILSIHMAYEIIYKIGSNTSTPGTLIDDGALILGCTHAIVNVFMAALSCATEESLIGKATWSERKKSLKKAGDLIRDAFNRIGTTEAGRDVMSVVKSLGKTNFLLWEYSELQRSSLRSQVEGDHKAKTFFYGWLLYLNNLHDFMRITTVVGFHPIVSTDGEKFVPLLKRLERAVITKDPSEDIKQLDRVLKVIVGLLKEKRGTHYNIIKGLNTTSDCKHETLLKAFLVMAMVRWTKMNEARTESSDVIFPIGWMVRNNTKNADLPLLMKCFRQDPDDKNEEMSAVKMYNELAVKDIDFDDPISLESLALTAFEQIANTSDNRVIRTNKFMETWKRENADKTLVEVAEDPIITPKKEEPKKRGPRRKANASKDDESSPEKETQETESPQKVVKKTKGNRPNVFTPPVPRKKDKSKLTKKEMELVEKCNKISWVNDNVEVGVQYKIQDDSLPDKVEDLAKLRAKIGEFYNMQRTTLERIAVCLKLNQMDSQRREYVMKGLNAEAEKGVKSMTIDVCGVLNKQRLDEKDITLAEKEILDKYIKDKNDDIDKWLKDEEQRKQNEIDEENELVEISKNINWKDQDVQVGEEYENEDIDISEDRIPEFAKVHKEIDHFYDMQVSTLSRIQFCTQVNNMTNDRKKKFFNKLLLQKAKRVRALTKDKCRALNNQDYTEKDIAELRQHSVEKYIGSKIDQVKDHMRAVEEEQEKHSKQSELMTLTEEEKDMVTRLRKLSSNTAKRSKIEKSEFMKAMADPVTSKQDDLTVSDDVKKQLDKHLRTMGVCLRLALTQHRKLKYDITHGEKVLRFDETETVITALRNKLTAFGKMFDLSQKGLYMVSRDCINESLTIDIGETNLSQYEQQLKEPSSNLVSMVLNLAQIGYTHISLDLNMFLDAFDWNSGFIKWVTLKLFDNSALSVLCPDLNTKIEKVNGKVDFKESEKHDDLYKLLQKCHEYGWSYSLKYACEDLIFLTWTSLKDYIEQVTKEGNNLIVESDSDISVTNDDEGGSLTSKMSVTNDDEGGSLSSKKVSSPSRRSKREKKTSNTQEEGSPAKRLRSQDNNT